MESIRGLVLLQRNNAERRTEHKSRLWGLGAGPEHFCSGLSWAGGL